MILSHVNASLENFTCPACIGFAAALVGDLVILPALLLVSFGGPSGEQIVTITK